MWTIALIIFGLTYFFIMSEKVHRTVVALAGAVTMIAAGVLTQDEAIAGVDFNTLGLLVGMMVIVGIVKHSGIFQYIAITTAKVGKGKPVPIFLLLGLLTALFSALLGNVATALLMVPVTFVVANNLKVSPKPFLFNAILLANSGGLATLIGDPANILIGSAADLSFNDFLLNTAPVAVIMGLLATVLLLATYRHELVSTPEAAARIMRFNPAEALSDRRLVAKSLLVIAIVLTGFITSQWTGLEGATVALLGAALLLLLTMHDPESYLRDVEWTTIFFFIGLFVLVVGLEHVGVIEWMAGYVIELTGGNLAVTTFAVLWGAALLSAIVDNIPFVATMIPLIQNIGNLTGMPIEPLWWALAIGANVGGDATIIGASTNVVVSGLAQHHGHKIGFFEYMRCSLLFVLVAVIVGSAYLWVRYL